MTNFIIISFLILRLSKLKSTSLHGFITFGPHNHIDSFMRKKAEKNYETPLTQVIEVKTEGVLASSGLDPLSNPLFFSPFEGGGEDW